MRRIIFGSITAGTVALVIGGVLWANRGSRSTPPPSNSDSSNIAEVKSDPVEETTSRVVSDDKNEATPAPAKNLEARIETTWESKLRPSPYPAGTEKLPPGTPPPANCALAGRVRLFAANEEMSQQADGKLTVMLFDHTPQVGLKDPLQIEEWTIDGDSLKHFLTENAPSPEYTFVLPWGTYKPEIAQIHIEVNYEPKSGKPLTAKTEILTLDHSAIKQ